MRRRRTRGQVVQYTRRWDVTKAVSKAVGCGLYNIVNRNSGKLLDDNGASYGHGSNIVQWTANGGSNQLWYFQATLTAPT